MVVALDEAPQKTGLAPRLMSGNEACAEAALAAGLRFFAGYPITPSSEIAEILSSALPRLGGAFIQMEDEIGAMGAVIGASLAGAKAMTATSGPGFSLKQENLGYACMTEVPCVVVNVQRGGPSTGLPTLPSQGDVMQSRWGTHGDHSIIVLCPRGVRETYDLTVRAFNLSEVYRTPVILLMDEIVAHVSDKVILPARIRVVERRRPSAPPGAYRPYDISQGDVPPMASFGDGYRFHVTGLAHDESGMPTADPTAVDRLIRRLDRKIRGNGGSIIQVAEQVDAGARVGVFAYGSTARAAAAAARLARAQGIPVDVLAPLTLWPFPEEAVVQLGERVPHIIVAEMNLGQMAHEVEWAVGRAAARGRPGPAGRAAEVDTITRVDGEPIRPGEILERIRELTRS